ncbi:metallophosphoesterase [soil metagenome]
MRVFALSDIHVDYDVNKRWIADLSAQDYRDDVLILAGDVSDSTTLLEWCLNTLANRFKQVLFVPGNHDLWVMRDDPSVNSLDKFMTVCNVAENCRVSMQTFHHGTLSIVPLHGWYDYSFGLPGRELPAGWMDFRACRWPDAFSADDITAHFLAMNQTRLNLQNETVISFSHFLPRIDVMPAFIPAEKKFIYPVLGTDKLDAQIRKIESHIHVYGHSHVNRRVTIDGVSYINNAFGYPQETRIAGKQLVCIFEM